MSQITGLKLNYPYPEVRRARFNADGFFDKLRCDKNSYKSLLYFCGGDPAIVVGIHFTEYFLTILPWHT